MYPYISFPFLHKSMQTHFCVVWGFPATDTVVEILKLISFNNSVWMHIYPEAAQLEMNTAAKKVKSLVIFLFPLYYWEGGID